MTTPSSIIQTDFDRIALHPQEEWNHNSHYHNFLLQHVPAQCPKALEVGCGTGAFARHLAARAQEVLAIDLSPNMIQVAKQSSAQFSNIDYQIGDALTWAFPAATYDCIASIATLHHMPFEEILLKLKTALKPNGTLMILDLFRGEGLGDLLTSSIAVPTHAILKWIKGQRLEKSQEEQAAWTEHSSHDTYLSLAEVRRISAALLPEARVSKHLLWRYSIIWTKTATNR